MHENTEEKTPYQKYRESGGILNETDYMDGIKTATSLREPEMVLNRQVQLQAKEMAKFANLNLDDNDKAIVLYGILRTDTNPDKKEYHHSQMSDQSLFMEALRMSEDTDSADKLIEAYHKKGTHCPICLKVPSDGEGCR
ncbi:MAG: hypothetical protein Q7K44_01780 [Candidatus Liptonbacteria bacterium]|nr:hypothetical protein [Candidatus Liptonbacteria bacterium]